MILGLTGGIAAGKSTVSAMLREAGCPIVDADEISRGITKKGAPGYEAVRRAFGPSFFAGGSLNRKKLAASAFRSPERTKKLNDVLHPLILAEMRRQIEKHQAAGANVIVLDVPLLVESGLVPWCDRVAVVSCETETRIQRAMARNHETREAVEARILRQTSDKEREAIADYIIRNDGSEQETARQVRAMLTSLGR